jgi:hypothetical protein
MEIRDWVTYFAQNQRDRLPITWSAPVTVPVPARPALAGLLAWLAAVERRDARRIERWSVGPATARLVTEKWQQAQLLDRLRHRLDAPARGARVLPEGLTGPWSVTAAVARAAILLRLYGAVRAAVPDSVVREVCDQVLHDTKFHLRFLCDQRRLAPRWGLGALALWAGLGVWWRHRRVLRTLGMADRDFAAGCWANVAAVEAAWQAGQPFRRGAAEQAPALVERRA